MLWYPEVILHIKSLSLSQIECDLPARKARISNDFNIHSLFFSFCLLDHFWWWRNEIKTTRRSIYTSYQALCILKTFNRITQGTPFTRLLLPYHADVTKLWMGPWTWQILCTCGSGLVEVWFIQYVDVHSISYLLRIKTTQVGRRHLCPILRSPIIYILRLCGYVIKIHTCQCHEPMLS